MKIHTDSAHQGDLDGTRAYADHLPCDPPPETLKPAEYRAAWIAAWKANAAARTHRIGMLPRRWRP